MLDCDSLCPWGNFFNLAKDGFVNNITNSCQINSTYEGYTTTAFPTTMITPPTDGKNQNSNMNENI